MIQNLAYWQISEILNRLEFIKGNLIANQIEEVNQQVKELLEFCKEVEEKIIASGYPGR